MWFPDNTPMLRSFKSRPLDSRLHEAPGPVRACRPRHCPGLRPCRRQTKAALGRERSGPEARNQG